MKLSTRVVGVSGDNFMITGAAGGVGGRGARRGGGFGAQGRTARVGDLAIF